MSPPRRGGDQKARRAGRASAKEIAKAGIDQDKAGKDQGNRKPGFRLLAAGELWPLGRGAFESGDIAAWLAGTGWVDFDVRCFARAAHLVIIALVDALDDGFRGLGLALLLQQRLVLFEEGLCFRRQG